MRLMPWPLGQINLGVGVYKDEQGRTPIMAAVKTAEELLLASETSQSYLGIAGHANLPKLAQALLLGSDHALIGDARVGTTQAPGGTGALRVAADFVPNPIQMRPFGSQTQPGRTTKRSLKRRA